MEHGNYIIKSKAADRFRALAIAHLDLQIAKTMVCQCVDDANFEDSDHEEALWTTALIRFRRAFSGGRGEAWSHEEAIAALDSQTKRSYNKFRMLADQFIAHSVGIGEDMAVTAVVAPTAQGAKAYAATVWKSRVYSLGTDLAKEFCTVLEALISIAAKLEDQAHTSLLQEVSTWSATDLTKGGLYSESIHFDESSPIYRRSIKKFSGNDG